MVEGMPRGIAPRLHERLRDVLRSPSRRRAALLRRTAAGVLVVLALILALAPAEGDATGAVLVAARDLASGAALTEADVAVATWPVELIPAGVLRGPADAGGRILAGAARAGEPLTDVRLAGPAPPGRTGDPRVAAVPVRLADADVAGLLVPGSRVDVITPRPGCGPARGARGGCRGRDRCGRGVRRARTGEGTAGAGHAASGRRGTRRGCRARRPGHRYPALIIYFDTARSDWC
jgi:hypothetical protein